MNNIKSIDIDRKLKWKQNQPLFLAFISFLVIVILSQVLMPGFLSANHMNTLVNQAAFLGIAAIGQMLVVMTGGIDMSIGYTVTLGSVLAANIMSHNNANTWKAIVIVILAGIIVGVINATGVYYLRIPSLVMTLGVGNIVYGFFLLYSDGAPSGYRSDMLAGFVNDKIGNVISGQLFIWLVLSVVMVILLKRMVTGRSIYAYGTNAEAARYSGVNSAVVVYFVYLVSAVLSSVVGLLLVGYAGSASIRAGDAYNMDTITAVVLGGTSISGGKGSYWGLILGVLIMYTLSSLLAMVNIPQYGKDILQGVIILAMILLVYRNRD